METWPNDSDTDSSLDINGFSVPLQQDRNGEIAQKSQGEGLYLNINHRRCTNVTFDCVYEIQYNRKTYHFTPDFNLVGWILDFVSDRSQCESK